MWREKALAMKVPDFAGTWSWFILALITLNRYLLRALAPLALGKRKSWGDPERREVPARKTT